MRSLYRGMKSDGEYPRVEASARGLGVRVGDGGDVQPDDDGTVHPGAGMSVAPDDPILLPRFRRPREFGGTGKDPVWRILDGSLPNLLAFVADAPDHGVICPAEAMLLGAYEAALSDTQRDWSRV
jgi:hypothetical protein